MPEEFKWNIDWGEDISQEATRPVPAPPPQTPPPEGLTKSTWRLVPIVPPPQTQPPGHQVPAFPISVAPPKPPPPVPPPVTPPVNPVAPRVMPAADAKALVRGQRIELSALGCGDLRFDLAVILFNGQLSGDTQGDKVVYHQKGNGATGMVQTHQICSGLECIYEGITIATIASNRLLQARGFRLQWQSCRSRARSRRMPGTDRWRLYPPLP